MLASLANKTALGFLNPLLYQYADALTDVTSGTQTGCPIPAGFSAVVGWDPVTTNAC